VLFLKSHFAEGTPVAAYAPNIPWVVKLRYVPLYKAVLPEIRSEQALQRWMIDKHLEAIYVDGHLMRNESALWALIESQIARAWPWRFLPIIRMFGFFASSKSAKSNLEAAASWISAGFLTLKLPKGVVSTDS
jgi:hypothetical protein